MHQLPNGRSECLVAGPPDATYRVFGIYIADIINHVAKAKGCSVPDLVEWINREMKAPTDQVIQTFPSALETKN